MAHNKTPSSTPWYASTGLTISFAKILTASEVLASAADVIDYWEEPWKRTREFEIWDDAGRPSPPSSDDLAEARMSGTGPQADELERKYSHNREQWDVFVRVVEAYEDGGTPLAVLPPVGATARTTL